MHTTQALYDELARTLRQVDAQIAAIKADWEKQRPFSVDDVEEDQKQHEAEVYRYKYTDGHYVILPMLVTRAQLLHAMADLKSMEADSRMARRR